MKLEEAFARKTYGRRGGIKSAVAEYALIAVENNSETFGDIVQDIVESDGIEGARGWARELDEVCKWCNPLVQPQDRTKPEFEEMLDHYDFEQ